VSADAVVFEIVGELLCSFKNLPTIEVSAISVWSKNQASSLFFE
jgi:hypothetical protein